MDENALIIIYRREGKKEQKSSRRYSEFCIKNSSKITLSSNAGARRKSQTSDKEVERERERGDDREF